MDEYITKEQVIEWFRPYEHTDESVPYYELVTDIREMKSADVAPVVRCKNCKHHYDCGVHFCDRLGMDCPDDSDFFCSYGERKPLHDPDDFCNFGVIKEDG